MTKRIGKKQVFLILSLIWVFSIPVHASKTEAPITILSSDSVRINTVTRKKILKVRTDPEGATLSFRSSDKNIVEVTSDGRLIGRGSGNAVITVIARKDGYDTTRKKVQIKVVPAKQTISVKKSRKLIVGNSLNLGAKAKTPLKYTSSDPKSVKVSKDGVITALRETSGVTITIRTVKSKLYTSAKIQVKITVTPRTDSEVISQTGAWLTVAGPGGIRKYHRYYTDAYYGIDGNYYPYYGCVVDAVSVVASGFGKDYSPRQIHMDSKTRKYSENYALVKLKATYRVSNKALGLRLAAQILKDMGIPNKRVSSFRKADAIKQITAHLKKGKPVIVKAHNRYVNGHRMANGHHAMVVLGIDKKGYGIFYDTSTGRLNNAHGSGTTFHMSVSQFVNNYMDSATGAVNSLYVYDYDSAGGYVLVG